MEETINPTEIYEYIKKEDLEILLVSKPFDSECQELFLNMIYSLQTFDLNLYTNSYSLKTSQEEHITSNYKDKEILNKVDFEKVKIYTEDNDKINRVITLGGDGTILYAIKMFYNKEMPPIISFGLGSLGYLCCFQSDDVEQVLHNCLFSDWRSKSGETPKYKGVELEKPYLQWKARLKIGVNPHSSRQFIQVNSSIFPSGNKKVPKGSSLKCLNELTLESDTFDTMLTVEVYIDDIYLTKVTALGLIFATPTGSTAYNMSAGGSIVQTEVKTIWVTPLSPFGLSFRPLIMPFDSRITIKVPNTNDLPFNGCIDGDFKFKLDSGDEITVTGSEYPAPFVTTEKISPIESWIKRLKGTILSE